MIKANEVPMILYIPISLLFSCGNNDNNQKEDISDSTEEDCNDINIE